MIAPDPPDVNPDIPSPRNFVPHLKLVQPDDGERGHVIYSDQIADAPRWNIVYSLIRYPPETSKNARDGWEQMNVSLPKIIRDSLKTISAKLQTMQLEEIADIRRKHLEVIKGEPIELADSTLDKQIAKSQDAVLIQCVTNSLEEIANLPSAILFMDSMAFLRANVDKCTEITLLREEEECASKIRLEIPRMQFTIWVQSNMKASLASLCGRLGITMQQAVTLCVAHSMADQSGGVLNAEEQDEIKKIWTTFTKKLRWYAKRLNLARTEPDLWE